MSAFTDHRQTVFQVELHNQAVRECVKENRSHEIFDDRWADVQTHEVAAKDEYKALAMIRLMTGLLSITSNAVTNR